MKHFVRCILAACALAGVAPAFAAFTIDQIYSNADGTVQYLVLRESSGLNNQQSFAGQTLTITNARVTKPLVFSSNLPSSATAGRRVLIGTRGLEELGLITLDYVVPNGTFATDGATVNFAGIDQVTYTALPTDGVDAFFRGGFRGVNTPANFAGAQTSLPALPVTVVEYYNGALDHFFISALQPDLDALDSGRLIGWSRTGQTFRVFPSQASGGGGVNPVCRFYIPPARGDSHFFSASPQECNETRAKFPSFSFEGAAVFFIALPNTFNGACPNNTVPVYRVWNNRGDSNHRYTTDRETRNGMVSAGFIAEGYGPDAVIMCAPA